MNEIALGSWEEFEGELFLERRVAIDGDPMK
jgi:hypothetical protein